MPDPSAGDWIANGTAVILRDTALPIASCANLDGNGESHALFISAAPEMHEVCKYVHNFIEGLLLDGIFDKMDGGIVRIQAERLLGMADHALAKSWGKRVDPS